MIAKIEVYTEVDFETSSITDHAVEQCLDRFNLKDKSKHKVEEWIRNKLKHSSFVSTVNSDKYGIARLFANGDIALVLDLNKNVVLTVYPIEVRRKVKTKIQSWMEQEHKRITNLYNKKCKTYTYKIADLNVEKATLERSLLHVKSKPKINELSSRIAVINSSITDMTRELCDLQLEKSEFEISLQSYNQK